MILTKLQLGFLKFLCGDFMWSLSSILSSRAPSPWASCLIFYIYCSMNVVSTFGYTPSTFFFVIQTHMYLKPISIKGSVNVQRIMRCNLSKKLCVKSMFTNDSSLQTIQGVRWRFWTETLPTEKLSHGTDKCWTAGSIMEPPNPPIKPNPK